MAEDEMDVDPLRKFIAEHPLPADYFDLAKLPKRDGIEMPILQPGQLLHGEVLEALPGRPITGTRVIRPDGTISLGFYGDLKVAGFNREQIKVKLLELLDKTVNPQILGYYFSCTGFEEGHGLQPDIRKPVAFKPGPCSPWLDRGESKRSFHRYTPPETDMRLRQSETVELSLRWI